VVGFQSGSITGALIVVTVVGGSETGTAAGALAGGALTAAAVYGLSLRGGRVAGYRLVLVGVGISALAVAANDFLLSRARVEDAQEATASLVGSLSGRGWTDVEPLALALLVLLPLCVPAGRGLRLLELGDDAAAALGLRVERARAGLVVLAVALVSFATLAVGPVAFVALTAPQIARRLARAASPPLGCSALTGAVVLLAADVLAQRAVPGTPLPVGLVTGALGGGYLLWLLGREGRSGRG
jgi:iron complex transport system permease protein